MSGPTNAGVCYLSRIWARVLAGIVVNFQRNHQIEAAIRAAEDEGDFSVFHELHAVLQNPDVPDEEIQLIACGLNRMKRGGDRR